MGTATAIAVVAHPDLLERELGAAQVLRGLGARVVTLGLWDEPQELLGGLHSGVVGERLALRAIVVELLDRPDWALAALRNLRRESQLAEIGTLAAVTAAQVARMDPAAGFDDFVLVPYLPDELYARIRQLEWRASEFSNEERIKIGNIVIDKQGREVRRGGSAVHLTQREFALLTCMAERRGRLLSRAELLARVWGERYEGGARTVDIHVRRLRQKLGDSMPLRTVRGAGYKIELPRESTEEQDDGS